MIYLHIGTHKTGTTAIQQALRNAAGRLAKDGLVFIEVPEKIQKLQFAGKVAKQTIEDGKCWLAEQVRLNAGKNLVISYEGFSGDMLLVYRNVPVIAKTLQGIIGKQAAVRIIVYYRNQADFLEECYVQQIHQGKTIGFQSFLASLGEHVFDWHWHSRQYAKLFSDHSMVIRQYPASGPADAIIHDFANAINSSELAKTKAGTPNRPYSRLAVDIACLCNPHLPENTRRQLRGLLQSKCCLSSGERHGFLTPVQRKEYMDRCRASNEQLEAKSAVFV